MDFVLSKHAIDELNKAGRSQIQREWITRTLMTPDFSDIDSRTNTIRVWKRIPEFGNRALRVVYNPNTEPITVVTVFLIGGIKVMFDISYDPEVDAAYVRIENKIVLESEEIADSIILDYDDHSEIIGVELLGIKTINPQNLSLLFSRLPEPFKVNFQESFLQDYFSSEPEPIPVL